MHRCSSSDIYCYFCIKLVQIFYDCVGIRKLAAQVCINLHIRLTACTKGNEIYSTYVVLFVGCTDYFNILFQVWPVSTNLHLFVFLICVWIVYGGATRKVTFLSWRKGGGQGRLGIRYCRSYCYTHFCLANVFKSMVLVPQLDVLGTGFAGNCIVMAWLRKIPLSVEVKCVYILFSLHTQYTVLHLPFTLLQLREVQQNTLFNTVQ